MVNATKQLIQKLIPRPILLACKNLLDLLSWKIKGGTNPPHIVKVHCAISFQKACALPFFIETGTYMGDMVNAVRNNFQQIYSIELDESLFARVSKKLSHFSHVHIIHGDSRKVLPELLSTLSQACLFWLDAHYSGGNTAKGDLECPIVGELKVIRKYPIKDNVILIDDARLFTGKNGWPTLNEIFNLLKKINPKYKIEVKDDIIRAWSKKTVKRWQCEKVQKL